MRSVWKEWAPTGRIFMSRKLRTRKLALAVFALFGCAGPPITSTPPQSSNASLGRFSQAPKFRDLVFGQAPAPGMVHAESDSGMPCYSRLSDDLRIGRGTLSSLRYCFYNGQMAVVVMKSRGKANSHSLFVALQAQYGLGYQPNMFMPKVFWQAGTPLNSSLSIVYEQNKLTGDATAVTSYQPLMNDMSTAKFDSVLRLSPN